MLHQKQLCLCSPAATATHPPTWQGKLVAQVRLLAQAVLCAAASPIWGMEVQLPDALNCQPAR